MKKINFILALFLMLTFLTGCQTQKTEDESSELLKHSYPNISILITVDNISKLSEMREAVKNENEFSAYIKENGYAFPYNRQDLIEYLNLVDSLPAVDLIEGEIVEIERKKGYTIDHNEYYDDFIISTKAENGDWTLVVYNLLSINPDSEFNEKKANGQFSDSILEKSVQNKDGKFKLYSETRRKHASGTGDMIDWTANVNGIYTYIAYYSSNVDSVVTTDIVNKIEVAAISEMLDNMEKAAK